MKTNCFRTFMSGILYFFLLSSLMGQNITGTVIDKETSIPLSFANVIALNNADSTYVSGTVTNENGEFSLNASSNQHLCISFLGYQKLTIPINKSDVGVVHLTPHSTELSEVVIKGAANIFKMENGGISTYIQNSRLKNMGSLTDVLGQLPFILKRDNSYTILGKGSPVFYINNRLVRNQNELQQINSSDIFKVTIITDPGAEYDASVNAVIKIETIRPAGEGISGNLYSYNKYNSEYSNWEHLFLNYRKSGLDVFTNMQFLSMKAPKDRLIINKINTSDSHMNIVSNSKDNDGVKSLSPQVGFNYLINGNHSFGAKYEYLNTYDLYGNSNAYLEVSRDNLLEEKINSKYRTRSQNHRHYVNGYYNGKLAKWVSVKLDLDFISNKGNRNANTISLSEEQNEINIITQGKTNSELYAGKLVFRTPFWQGNLIYGIENSYTSNEQMFTIVEEQNVPGVIPSSNSAKQNFFGGFVSFSRSLKNISLEIGARYENVRFKYYQDEKYMSGQSKNFKKIFPNARLAYKDDNIQMQLAYRYGVRRPGYADLRSAVLYQAPYSYSSGNPMLQPTYQRSLSYTLLWKNINFIAVYNQYDDFIVELPELYLDNSILFRPVNFNKDQLTISVNYGHTIGWWKPNIELSIAKDFVNYGVPEIKYNKPVYSVNFRNSFQTKGWLMGLDMRVHSKGNQNIEYRKTTWNMNVYLNKSFWKNRLLMNISAGDIFNTSNDELTYSFNKLNSNHNNSMNRRNVVVQMTYRFNSVKKKYAGSSATTEIERL